MLNKEPEKSKYLNLIVVDDDGDKVYFRKMKFTTPLSKVMHAFCQLQGLRMGDAVFLYAGEVIKGTQTPDELGIVDGDEIEVQLV